MPENDVVNADTGSPPPTPDGNDVAGIAGSVDAKTGDATASVSGQPSHPEPPTEEEIAAALADAASRETAATLEHGESTGVDTTEIQPAPAWTELNPLLAFEAGKHSIELERAASIEIHLAEQKVTYEKVLASGRTDLIVQALLDRDRLLAQVGRQIADGRMGGKMLREFVRACLSSADRAADPQALQTFLEEVLGAQKADRRQLKQRGTTL